MRIICAPDSFKESISAVAAAEAMAAGIRKAIPDAVVDCCPIADGGEGTLAALASAMPARLHREIVSGPLGEPLDCEFATFADDGLAVVESAAALGLHLVPPGSRDPTRTSSRGVGELIAAASRTPARKLIVAVGGSSSNDGGCGMAQALAVRFYGRDGNEICEPVCGGMLSQLGRIDAAERLPNLNRMQVIAACDVQNALTGSEGAACVYAPQKGANAAQVEQLDAGLRHLAALVRRDLDVDIEYLPGSGAGGGLGGGLVAFAGATVNRGIDTVLEGVNFENRVHDADLCLTGEGQIDAQSVAGKACMGVARLAAKHHVPTIALAGAAGPGAEKCLEAGLQEYVIIGEGLPAEVSKRQAAVLIAESAGRVVKKFLR